MNYRLIFFGLLLSSLVSTTSVFAQIQLEWIYTRHYPTFVDGEIFSSSSDGNGGIYLGGATSDSVCYYSMGEVSHVNSSGNAAWIEWFYDETPCLQQGISGVSSEGTSIWLAVSDTTGHLIKIDSAALLQWTVDTALALGAIDIDSRGFVSSVAYAQQSNYILCFDALGTYAWTFAPPYVFQFDTKAIVSDRNSAKLLVFDYDDPAQAEPKGVGIIKLDSNGVFLWDTFINPQVWQADADVYVDAKLDTLNNLYVLARDIGQFGAFISKIDKDGNVVASVQYTPSPYFFPTQMELDLAHSLLYVAGRNNQDVFIIKFDLDLNVMDTMSFPLAYPTFNVIGINEYGYLFHSCYSDNNGIPEIRLEMYNHLGALVDSYVYWDSTLYSYIAPDQILFDSLGGIFLTCNARDTNSDDVGMAFKFSNPLSVLSPPHSELGMVVFPIPASDIVNISIQSLSSNNSMQLYDMNGELVFSSAFTGSRITLATGNFSSGMYFVEVVTDSGERSTQKVIIQH